ncbi:MAG: beta-phosphoglucomutase, partial [Oscillospiraceae bacterium]|nr:beta-phosphoglucomutase [Oscillospiraceae bacterium]
MTQKYKGLLFDLDGVLVDTAKYHFLAWKQLAEELDIPFTKEDNERLKGVSRMASFEIILQLGNRTLTQAEKDSCCTKKNDLYVQYINELTQEDILPGVQAFLTDAREKGYKIGLGSASKNSALILNRLKITDFFDAVIDGTKVSQAKPNPEVFLQGAKELNLPP